MKPLPRGWLALCLATTFFLVAVQSASAQRAIGQPNRPGGNFVGQPGGNNFGQPGGNNFGQPGGNNFGQPGGPNFGQPNGFNAAPNAAAAVSGFSTGMMIGGIFLIIAGLGLTGGVVYFALQGQKTGYGGGRRRKKRRDNDDDYDDD